MKEAGLPRALLPAESLQGSGHGRVLHVKSPAQVDEDGPQSPPAGHGGGLIRGASTDLEVKHSFHKPNVHGHLPGGPAGPTTTPENAHERNLKPAERRKERKSDKNKKHVCVDRYSPRLVLDFIDRTHLHQSCLEMSFTLKSQSTRAESEFIRLVLFKPAWERTGRIIQM